MKIALWIVFGLVLLFFVLEYLIFLLAFRGRVYRDITKTGELNRPSFLPYRELILNGIRVVNESPCELVSVQSYDGLTLRGRFYQHPEPRGVILLCHGYRSIAENDFSGAFEAFYNRGLSVLLIDHRAHGRSDGRLMTFGIRERHDVHTWAAYLAERFPELPMVVDGISMGAATVLMASGEPFPATARGLVLDCGYSSAKDAILHVLRRFHAPAGLYPLCRLAGRMFGRFDLEEVTAEGEGAKSTLPALFLHGERDYLVPCEQGRRNFAAYGGPKTLITVPCAGHGMSYLVERERVERELDAFFDAVLRT